MRWSFPICKESRNPYIFFSLLDFFFHSAKIRQPHRATWHIKWVVVWMKDLFPPCPATVCCPRLWLPEPSLLFFGQTAGLAHTAEDVVSILLGGVPSKCSLTSLPDMYCPGLAVPSKINLRRMLATSLLRKDVPPLLFQRLFLEETLWTSASARRTTPCSCRTDWLATQGLESAQQSCGWWQPLSHWWCHE